MRIRDHLRYATYWILRIPLKERDRSRYGRGCGPGIFWILTRFNRRMVPIGLVLVKLDYSLWAWKLWTVNKWLHHGNTLEAIIGYSRGR